MTQSKAEILTVVTPHQIHKKTKVISDVLFDYKHAIHREYAPYWNYISI